MNEKETEAIFAEVHKAISESADSVLSALGSQADAIQSYPPGSELTEEERKALAEIELSVTAKNALKKIVLDACSYPTFHLCSLLDGVTEPYVIELDEWLGGTLGAEESDLMLHDQFFDTYHTYETNS